MELQKVIKINDAEINIYTDSEGTVILGGFNWIEYYDYVTGVNFDKGGRNEG